MMQKTTTLSAIAAMAALAYVPAVADPIRNHSFELPLLVAGGFAGGNNKTLHYWLYSPHAFLVSAANPAPGGSVWWPSAPCPPGYAGSQFGAVEWTASLSQTFTLSASGDFSLTWLAAGRPTSYGGCCNGDQSYVIEVDGSVVGRPYSTTSGEPFTHQHLSLKGLSAGVHTVMFQGLVSDSDETAFIDDVRLRPKQDGESQLPPQPSSIPSFFTR